MKLGVDIDGTIKQTQKAAVEVYNQVLDKDVRLEDVHSFYLDSAYGLDRKEGRKLWRKLEHRIYQLAVPQENASEALNQLKREGHEIYFITARPQMPHIAEVTREWLSRYRFPFDGHNLFMNAQDKADVAKRLHIDLFFEDAPAHLDRLTEEGIYTVIVDAPYNRDYPKNLPRLTSWVEVQSLIRKYARPIHRIF